MKRLLLILLCIGIFFFSIQSTYAATPSIVSPNEWTKDSTVTFLGRGAIRAQNFMDWTLNNYKWNYLDGPLADSWKAVRNIVYTMSILAVLVTSFLIILKGSQSVSVTFFIKEFIIALLLITFSWALARLIFDMADIFQYFFFQTAGTGSEIISGKDIINISFPENFTGYRKNGIAYDESAFISLLLVQATSITFYVIGCLLTVRKIILWFFIISAPLYPILLIYKPIKKTGKIWIQEFLRWLFYGPLFALFLSAVVVIWKKDILTLPFSFGLSTVNYPTAISILVGGPGQSLSLTNSLNYNDTFIQYVVALLMLWIVILMPFILLQIILGFLEKYDFGINPMHNVINNMIANPSLSFPFLKKSPPPSPFPVGQHPGGLARELPKYKTVQDKTDIKNQVFNNISSKSSNQNLVKNISETSNQNSNTNTSKASSHNSFINASRFQTNQSTQNLNSSDKQTKSTNTSSFQTNQSTQNLNSSDKQTKSTNTSSFQTNQNTRNYQQTSQFSTKTQLKPDILSKPITRLINFSIPSMSDIVKFETARLNRSKAVPTELKKVEESLIKIANPKRSSNAAEEDKFISLQDKLNQETAQGNVLAESILSAAIVVRKPSSVKEVGDQSSIDLSKVPSINLPTVNQIQTVSFEDYDIVKNLWLENYQQSDIPTTSSSRKEWIEEDIKTISKAITLLSSSDPNKVNEGLSSVSDIVPFFLIGGFSESEIIAYLKAKNTAAKLSLEEIIKDQENQDTLLKKSAQKTASQQLSREVEIDKAVKH